ncbi:MAG: hypothetical protein ACRC67_37665 [Inquilinus sp.]|uniref:hypothetical protein n=1 Tax=Inquilinus sp. TaxID=1932117 RepID=UPI003F413CE3
MIYNNPFIGQAISNIAQLFAPPSAGDMAAGAQIGLLNAKTQSERQSSQRLADFYAKSIDPNTPNSVRDAYGVGAGVFNPNQSYYGVDTAASTSRANNEADNARALAQTQMESDRALALKKLDPFAVKSGEMVFASPEAQQTYGIGPSISNFYATDSAATTSRANNEADNTRALEDRRMQESGAYERKKLEPFAVKKDEFAYASPEAQAIFGVPGESRGIVSVQPGEAAVMPWGGRIEGAPKPLNESEWKAQQGAELRGRGLISDDQMRAAIMGDTPVETVLGPDGKPRIVARPDAIGQQPAPKAQEVSGIGKMIERDALPAGDPRRAEYDRAISASGAPRQETAYDQEIGRQFAQGYAAITTKADAARQNSATLDALDQALSNPDVVTGALGPTALGLRRAAVAMGIGDADTVADSELVQTIGNQLALQLRNPETGMGMPGAVSDRDLQFLRESVPGLANSVAGNRRLLDYTRRLNQRAMQVEQLANDYAQRNGRLDTGFRAELAQWAAANPLFAEAQAAAQPSPAPQPGQQSGGPARVTNDAEYDALPSGAAFVGPDGVQRRKP